MSNRIEKVNKLLKEELAVLIQKENFKSFVTVNYVETSPDLSWAKIGISILNGNEKKLLSDLNEKKYEFQSYLGKKLYIKNIPKLNFLIDHSASHVEKIESILNKIKK